MPFSRDDVLANAGGWISRMDFEIANKFSPWNGCCPLSIS